jgi:hypothetical protein
MSEATAVAARDGYCVSRAHAPLLRVRPLATPSDVARPVVATSVTHEREVLLLVAAVIHELQFASPSLPLASARPPWPDDAHAIGDRAVAMNSGTASPTDGWAGPMTNDRSGVRPRPGPTTAWTALPPLRSSVTVDCHVLTVPPSGDGCDIAETNDGRILGSIVQSLAPHQSAAGAGRAAGAPFDACHSNTGGRSTGLPDTMRARTPHPTSLGGGSSLPAVRHAPAGHASAESSQPETRPD